MIDFVARFQAPRDHWVSGLEYWFRLTLDIEGVSADEIRRRMTEEKLRLGYRLLGQASSSEAIFEHRAVMGASLSERQIEVLLWVPVVSFKSLAARILYVNFLMEDQYWFHDRGWCGTYVALSAPPPRPSIVPMGPGK